MLRTLKIARPATVLKKPAGTQQVSRHGRHCCLQCRAPTQPAKLSSNCSLVILVIPAVKLGHTDKPERCGPGRGAPQLPHMGCARNAQADAQHVQQGARHLHSSCLLSMVRLRMRACSASRPGCGHAGSQEHTWLYSASARDRITRGAYSVQLPAHKEHQDHRPGTASPCTWTLQPPQQLRMDNGGGTCPVSATCGPSPAEKQGWSSF